ncbi:hypothetical protein VZQ01_09910 [Myxococcus faecalis]|jgi:hypothetical protein|uniref:hypothetical protein n=1 Tax=Myxococcus faecalis TaxID=3115646 RepID=UPI0038D1C39B
MGIRLPSFNDVKKTVTRTVDDVKDTVVDKAKGVKDTVVDKAQDAKKAVVDTSRDVFEDVKRNPVADAFKKAITDPKDLARDVFQTGLRTAYHGANALLPDGATNVLLKGTELGVDALAKTSEVVLGKDASLTDSLKKLGEVDLEAINRTTDPVTGQKLEADWTKLWGTWLLEEKPADLGTWDKTTDGEGRTVDRVTITDDKYTQDLAGRPHQQQLTEEFFKMYPNPKPGDVFPPTQGDPKVIADANDKALYRFTGPGTSENNKDAPYTALEWFMGSYRTQIECTGIDPKTGKPNLEYKVTNNSHLESGTRVPQSFQDKGLPDALVGDVERERGLGIGGSFIQDFVWTSNGVDNPNK